jgi:predicted AAA+ superfamily ATPase
MGDWFEKLDFDEDPFTVNPTKFLNALVGLDEAVKEIVYRINAGSLLVIVGEDGLGKTTLLMKAAKVFGGRGKVAYVDCAQLDKKLNITHILQEKYGIWGKILNKKPKNMILLLDNVQNISKVNNERLKYYFDQGYLKSIVFATTSFARAHFSDSLKDRVGERIVRLEKLKEGDASEVVRQRIGESDLINDELATEILKLSSYNPKIFLGNLSRIAERAVSKNRNRIQQIDIEEELGVKNE